MIKKEDLNILKYTKVYNGNNNKNIQYGEKTFK